MRRTGHKSFKEIDLLVEGFDKPVLLRKNPRARRFTLRVSHTNRQAILTVPTYSKIQEASEFLAEHEDWLRQKLNELPEPIPFANDEILPFKGDPHLIQFVGSTKRRGVVYRVREGSSKGTKSQNSLADQFGDLPLICVTGAEEHGPRRLADWLKSEARKEIDKRVSYHADELGLSPKRLSIRDQSSRWGSCSTTGVLSFSWRLILAPSHVLDYVAAHEVAHLKEMNHGPKFWRLVRKTFPDMEEPQHWLSQFGAELHRYGMPE